jgi:phytoene dehydrogenase-like protein
VLGYLARGWLSRPIGGTARFRDALIERYRALGGEALVNTTVEEILVSDRCARGVRLTDGTMLEADVVVSTSSVPETVFRLLAGRHGTSQWNDRMERWKMFRPIVPASYGVYEDLKSPRSRAVFGRLMPPEAPTFFLRTLPGLERFYLAGQWLEPGGGVSMATMSGRHVVEIICAAQGRQFRASLAEHRVAL